MFKKILMAAAFVTVSSLSPIYATEKCPNLEKRLQVIEKQNDEIEKQNKDTHELLELVLENMHALASLKK